MKLFSMAVQCVISSTAECSNYWTPQREISSPTCVLMTLLTLHQKNATW